MVLRIKGPAGHKLNWVPHWVLFGSTLQHFLQAEFDDIRSLPTLCDEANRIFLLLAVQMDPLSAMVLTFQDCPFDLEIRQLESMGDLKVIYFIALL